MTSDKKEPKLPKGWKFLDKVADSWVDLEYKDDLLLILKCGDIIIQTYYEEDFRISNFCNFARDVKTIGKLYFGKKWGKG